MIDKVPFISDFTTNKVYKGQIQQLSTRFPLVNFP